ncbi:endonuclease/exonuclease/phosphatase family protein [Sulfitobacter sp. S190]|uniref:endonuclease/exonuclease/phosphatase family protein n=1 Tax=Sulfitobacter sp. S190 TaxID=2867022 RepID=UPI0021A5B453|nr:endonuclease/exonuclease/phosphatase family protein [Sulfitobacter sp. S190]UWR21849.1 endonuclease/exonuclease/phosphatase family protein [Sulfitobacter sp. S190]
MRLRLCTFNIENLFLRHDFDAFSDRGDERYLDPVALFYAPYGNGDLSKFEQFKRTVETAAIAQADDFRQHTALAMIAADADVYCLQEVDNFTALQRFLRAYYTKAGGDSLPHRVLQEGNDFRGIDVAALGARNYPFYARSHATLTPAWLDDEPTGEALLAQYDAARVLAGKMRGKRIFRRDCLEIVLDMRGTPVTVFNCHFKSMGSGEDKGHAMRQLEALTVREIINRKFPDPAQALWAVVGDLNDAQEHIFVSRTEGRPETIRDYAPSGNRTGSGVDPLLDGGFGINLAQSLDPIDRWSQFYANGPTKSQLDYIIASPALAEMVSEAPRFIREGQPYRVPNTDDINRYPRVGWDRPKASDHCPLVVAFDIPRGPVA